MKCVYPRLGSVTLATTYSSVWVPQLSSFVVSPQVRLWFHPLTFVVQAETFIWFRSSSRQLCCFYRWKCSLFQGCLHFYRFAKCPWKLCRRLSVRPNFLIRMFRVVSVVTGVFSLMLRCRWRNLSKTSREAGKTRHPKNLPLLPETVSYGVAV